MLRSTVASSSRTLRRQTVFSASTSAYASSSSSSIAAPSSRSGRLQHRHHCVTSSLVHSQCHSCRLTASTLRSTSVLTSPRQPFRRSYATEAYRQAGQSRDKELPAHSIKSGKFSATPSTVKSRAGIRSAEDPQRQTESQPKGSADQQSPASTIESAQSTQPEPSSSQTEQNQPLSDVSESRASLSASPNTPTPSPPTPSPPKSGIAAWIANGWSTLKFLAKFYFNGVKQIYRDRQRVNEIKALCLKEGRETTWSEKRLLMTHRLDCRKLPLFLAILVILEEILPLIVIYAPFLLPSTCILPSQLQKIRHTEEVRRSAAVEELRKSSAVQELFKAAELPIRPTQSLQALSALSEASKEKVRAAWEALTREQLISFSRVFDLPTNLRTGGVLRKNLEKHLDFIQDDDAFFYNWQTASEKLAIEDSAIPGSMEVLPEVLGERGLTGSGVGVEQMLDTLRQWLNLVSDFAERPTSTSQTPPPLQYLLLPLSLYPSNFTPTPPPKSGVTSSSNSGSESKISVTEQAQAVVKEVVEAQKKHEKEEAAIKGQTKGGEDSK